MAETTIDETPTVDMSALQNAAREFERARMKQIGGFHFAIERLKRSVRFSSDRIKRGVLGFSAAPV